MSDAGISQGALARAIGVTAPAIQQLVNGTTKRTRMLSEIARTLNVAEDWLMGLSDAPDRRNASFASPKDVIDSIGYSPETAMTDDDVQRIKAVAYSPDDIFSYSLGSFLIGDLPNSTTRGLSTESGEAYAMEPTIHGGDVLLVRAYTEIQHQDAVWRFIYGNIIMVRRLVRMPRARLLIRADNPAVADIEVDEGDVTILGKVLCVWHKLY